MSEGAQFGNAFILRPYAGFATDNQDRTNAIQFSPAGTKLDGSAGSTGYSPVLVNGIKAPIGARLLLWIPTVQPTYDAEAPTFYTYALVWRLRNLFDFRKSRKPFHFVARGEGAPNYGPNPDPIAEPRIVIPAAFETIIYQPEQPALDVQPTDPISWAVSQAFRSDLITSRNGSGAPNGFPDQQLLPVYDTTNPDMPVLGQISQGVLPSQTVQSNYTGYLPSFLVYDTICKGDDLVVLVYKNNTAVPEAPGAWDFDVDGVDYAFNQLFGSTPPIPGQPEAEKPQVGIYAMFGHT